MNLDVNIVVLVGQFILAAVLVFFAARKAPKELAVMNATTTAQYAQAAKLKAEENSKLQDEIDELRKHMEAIEKKRYKVFIELLIGDYPEILKSEVVVVEPPPGK